ncbi:metal-dependent hydrolase [Halorutilales archaeon Cl-col2-1]
MFVGHAALAFAVAAGVTVAAGWDRDKALRLGVVAAAFGAVPDVDMAYAVLGFLGSGSIWGGVESFWEHSTVTHRGITHSLIVGTVAAFGFGAAARSLLVSTVVLGSLVVGGVALGGSLTGGVALLFGLVGGGIGVVASREFTARTVTGAAVLGLITHPFGDIFTGETPDFVYPLGFELFEDRVVLVSDATLNLLGVFLLELSVIWLGVYVYSRLRRRSVRSDIDLRALAGVFYVLAVPVISPPTLDRSYHFVFTAVSVGVVGSLPLSTSTLPSSVSDNELKNPIGIDADSVYSATVTGLTGVTVAVLAYAVGYIAV